MLLGVSALALIFGNFWCYGPWPDEALVKIINRTTSQNPTVMIFVRQLVLACLKLNILFRAKHVPGAKNTLADALSRLQVSKFCWRRQVCRFIHW